MTRPGEPEEIADPNYCFIHRVVEKPGFLRCGECMHWFTDEAELVRDYNEGVDPLAGIDVIFFCPHCAHDF